GVQVIHMFGRMYFPGFTLPLLSVHSLGGPYLLLKDIFQALVLVSIGVAFTRWLVTRPARLYGYAPAEEKIRGHSHWEAFLILGCIAMIMIGGYLYDGGMMAVHPDTHGDEKAWQPISWIIGTALVGVFGAGIVEALAYLAQWMHNIAVLVMLNFLPQA